MLGFGRGSRGAHFQLVARISQIIPLFFFALDSRAQTTDICDRTSQIEATILRELGLSESDCGSVPTDDLAKITRIRAYARNITSLKSGDFAGLDNLERLYLNNNSLASLPEDLFDGLSSLSILWLSSNALTSLPEDVFDGLSSLKKLYLYDNSLSSLPEDLFDGPSSLGILFLYSNSLASLPADLFDGLSSLEGLDLNNNSLASLPEDLFDGLSSLKRLDLNNNSLASLPEDLFDGLSSLERLDLYNNSLASLPEDLFDGLSSLDRLDVDFNRLTTLPADLFDGLSSLNRLWLANNALTSLPEDLLDGLSNLEILYLHRNALTSVPEDLLDGITKLRHICLDQNRLTTLPEKFFDQKGFWPPLDVWLRENRIECLPATILNNPYLAFLPPKNTFRVCGAAPTVTLKLSAPRISENGGSTTVTATMNRPSSAKTTVTVSAAAQRPALESDYNLSTNRTLTIAAGATRSTGTVTITAVDNDRDEPDKTVTVSGTATNTQGITNPSAVTLTITDDDDDAPTVTLALSTNSISEKGGITTVTAKVDRVSSTATTVTISATSQSPATSSDYELSTNTTLTIAAGDTASTGTVTITAVDNDRDEPDKTITVSGTATGTETVTGPADVTLTIEDDEDVPTVTLALSTNPIDENGGITAVTATLDRVSSAATTVTILAVPVPPATSSDYKLSPRTTLTIAAGATSSTGTVTITAVDNDRDERDKTVKVLGSATNTQGVTNPSDLTLTITNDDHALISAPTSVAVTEGGSTDFLVALSAQPSGTVTVTVTGYGGTDLTPNPLILTFTAVNWSTPQTVTLAAVEDEDFVSDEALLTLTGSGGGYDGVTHSVAVMITDNDVASVTAPASVVVPEGSTGDLSVALSVQPMAAVTLTIAGHAATDLTPTPIALTFTPMNWSTPQLVTLTAGEDDDVTDDEVALTLTGSGGGYTGVTHLVAVTITDNDVPSVAAPASMVVPEGGPTFLQVALSAQPAATVTLMVTGHAGTDLTPAPRTLTFTTTNWSTSQPVRLTAAEDEDFMDDEEILTLTASGGGYDGVTHSVAVTITDNDAASVMVPTSVVVPEGGSRDLPVALWAQPTAAVMLTVTGHGGTDLTLSPRTLTFTTTNWSVPQPVRLTAAEDEDYADDPVALTLTGSGGGYTGVTHSVAVTITDNDLAPPSLSIHDLQIREDAKTGQMRVELNPPSDKMVVVRYTTSDGTGEAPSDYMSSRGLMLFEPGSVRGRISVKIVDDAIPEGDETLTVTLSNPRNAIIQRGVGTLTIVDNDGGVTLAIEDEVGFEDAGDDSVYGSFICA